MATTVLIDLDPNDPWTPSFRDYRVIVVLRHGGDDDPAIVTTTSLNASEYTFDLLYGGELELWSGRISEHDPDLPRTVEPVCRALAGETDVLAAIVAGWSFTYDQNGQRHGTLTDDARQALDGLRERLGDVDMALGRPDPMRRTEARRSAYDPRGWTLGDNDDLDPWAMVDGDTIIYCWNKSYGDYGAETLAGEAADHVRALIAEAIAAEAAGA